jgi:hypothetical protein
MWHSEYYKDRTEKLWGVIANRYKTNTTVLGYDLFNEPDFPRINDQLQTYSRAFSNNIMPMLDRLHTAIRSNDTEHVLFMESNLMYAEMWEDKDYLWWPDPAVRGWTNVCYEFHVYDRIVYGKLNNDEDSWFIHQKPICDTMVRAFSELRESRNVPVYVGEYAPWNEQNFEYWTRQLQANDIHWGHWNYRSWGWDNPKKPEEGKTIWGLDYRSKATTNETPDLQNDSYAELIRKMSLYGYTNYTDNTPLQNVVAHHLQEPELSKGACEFFMHTFSARNSDYLSTSWPWNKVACIGNTNQFRINSGAVRLWVNTGPATMRCKSREEADARFKINDEAGCRFAVDVAGFAIQSMGAGTEVAINLCAVRDSISSSVSNYDTRAVIARLEYDQNTTNVDLYVYAKDGGVNTLGTEKCHIGPLSFVTNGTLELIVNRTNVTLRYAGAEYANVSHGLDLDQWPGNAVCVLEAEELAGESAYVEMDNLCGERSAVTWTRSYDEQFTNYVAGIRLGAVPDRIALRDVYAETRQSKSYVVNESAYWLPEETNKGGTWYNPHLDYQNAVRVVATTTNVIEVRAAFSNYTDGTIKIAMLPESFPSELYNDYNGPGLYTQVQFDEYPPPSGPTLYFQVFRQWGNGGANRVQLGSAWWKTYVPGQPISFQIDDACCKLYYGSSTPIVDVAHGTNIVEVYPYGVYPHLEFQNMDDTTNLTITMENAQVRHLSEFTAP